MKILKKFRLSFAGSTFLEQQNRDIPLFMSLILLYLTILFSGLAVAEELTVFGPETFIRERGAPVTVTRSFTTNDQSGIYKLQIINGIGRKRWFSGAKIYLNDVKLKGRWGYKRKIHTVSLPVTLKAVNTLTVKLYGKPGRQLTISISKNQTPLADAGADQTIAIGNTVQLDASGSTDNDGDSLSYQWTIFTKPVNSQAEFSDPGSIMPTLTIDKPGSYTLVLIVNDGYQDSVSDQVIISTDNSAPIAFAGPDQTALVGETVMLDASQSYDHQW